MQTDVVAMVVSTGISVSVFAGILSGVCYVFLHRFKAKRNNNKPSLQWHCTVCGNSLRSIEGILEGEKVVTCKECNGRVCRIRCCTKDLKNAWICQKCLKPQSWFKGIYNVILPQKDLGSGMDSDQINEDIEAIREKEKNQIRDFIEKIVTAMLDGNSVDDASITKLYNDKQYDTLFEKYHQEISNALTDLGSALHISIANLPISGQSPCTAHTALKQIIQRLLREALDLPNLKKTENHPAVPLPDESSRTYEDLLATAILNKVISNSQNNLPSSSASVSSRISASTRRLRDEKEYFFSDETLDDKYKNQDLETTSISSLEEWIQSDSSFGSTKYVDRVSLTIQQRIDEASQSDTDDDSDYFQKSSSLLLTDDDSNWYLQKRQFHNSTKGTNSPVPVPMLVPNPTNDAKVLIGDKELDDTSDLSDIASDYGDIEDSIPTINNVLIDSKTVIGGKNLIDTIHLSDNESSADSGVREDRGEEDDERFYEQHKTDVTVDDENIEDTSLQSIYSNTEKDTEYTEKYATLPKKIPLRLNNNISEIVPVIVTATENNEKPIQKENNVTMKFEGYCSKREKEKWKNPVEMKNNPYSKENIEKRIRLSKTFGRDYYTRQASIPSGGEKTAENSSRFSNEQDLYKAIPTIIDDNYKSDKQDDNISELTSDSDLSFVNCYDVENSKVSRKSSNSSQTEIKVDFNTEAENVVFQPKISINDIKPVPQKRHKIKTDSDNLNHEENLCRTRQISSENAEKNEFSLELSDIEIIPNLSESPEICELKDKHLVSNRLGEFSKSFPNLNEIHTSESREFISSNYFVSVKDLRKKFENKDSNHIKDKFVHSLTGRSLSKPIREKLKIQETFQSQIIENCAKTNGVDHLLLCIEENTVQSSNC